jgi:hypothetical protein
MRTLKIRLKMKNATEKITSPVSVTAEKRALVAVGKGRGFVIETNSARLVVTAAHCLRPKLPPAASISYTKDRTYCRLLGTVGKRRSVSAECLFVDPVADIAVLASPDRQDLSKLADATG